MTFYLFSSTFAEMPVKTTISFLSALLRLTRFWNLIIIALAQYFAVIFFIDRNGLFDLKLFLLSATTLMIAAAGYIINDYYDIKIDLINKPDRVVIGKSITRRFAILFHTILSATGVCIGFLVSWKIGAVNFFSATLLWWYSNNLKRQPFIGNFSVALLTGLSIFIVNILYGVNNIEVIIYSLFAFFMTLIRELIKDMEDLKGDNSFGCKTLPILWGIRKSKFWVYGELAVFAAIVLMINDRYVLLPLVYFVIFLFIPLVLLLIRLIRADTVKDFYNLSQFCKMIMLLGILSMPFV